MTVARADLNNQPVPRGWILTGVTKAQDTPRARWVTKQGEAKLTFPLERAQNVTLALNATYPFRLQSLSVYLNGKPLGAGQTAEAWYSQSITLTGRGQPGINTVVFKGAGPSGQPEGFLRLNQIKVALGEPSPALPGAPLPAAVILLALLTGLTFASLRRKVPATFE